MKFLEAIRNRYLNIQEDELVESIHDKNIFKSVILAGSPGAGKSYVVKKTYPNIKIINSDDLFEYLLDKNNLSKIIDSKAPDYNKKMALRNFGKKLTMKKESFYVNSMLPIIIDGTGREIKRVSNTKKWLESLGYDVSLVLVDVDLETAKRRNQQRTRKVPEEDILIPTWKSIQDNKNSGEYKNLFGEDYYLISNNDDSKVPQSYFDMIYKKTIESPHKNPVGKKYLDQLERIGGKYLIDLDVEKVHELLDEPQF